MGIIRTGANGGFSGKAGSVVGSSWKDINYIKGLPKKSSKAPSQLQLEQQAKFALTVKVLQPITNLLNEGFSGARSGRVTGYNVAVREFIKDGITGTYPDYAADYSKIPVSRGNLMLPMGISATADAAGLHVTWDTLTTRFGAFDDDQVMVLIYNPVKNIYIPFEGAKRQDGEFSIELPAGFSGDTIHVYVFLTSRDFSRRSNSAYAGQVVIP